MSNNKGTKITLLELVHARDGQFAADKFQHPVFTSHSEFELEQRLKKGAGFVFLVAFVVMLFKTLTTLVQPYFRVFEQFINFSDHISCMESLQIPLTMFIIFWVIFILSSFVIYVTYSVYAVYCKPKQAEAKRVETLSNINSNVLSCSTFATESLPHYLDF